MEGTKSIVHNYLHEFALQNADILQTGNWLFVQDKLHATSCKLLPTQAQEAKISAT